MKYFPHIYDEKCFLECWFHGKKTGFLASIFSVPDYFEKCMKAVQNLQLNLKTK